MKILFLILIYSCNSLKISLIRHSNTLNNVNNIYTGQLDIPIMETSTTSNKNDYDLILSSPMLRCKQTLGFLEINAKVIYDKRLIECGYGELTGKKKNEKLFKRNFFNKPNDNHLYSGESIFDAGLRSYNCLNYHKAHSFLDSDNILILSHKNTLKGLWVFIKLEELFNNKDINELNDFNKLKKNINYILDNFDIPEFNNLELYEI